MGIEDPDYQVGARFEALDEGVLAAASKSTGYFFAISISQKVRCFGFEHCDSLRKTNGVFATLKVALLGCVIDTE